MWKLSPGVLLLVVGASIIVLLAAQFRPTSGCPAGQPERTLTFAANDLEGRRWVSADLRGQPVVLLFWSSWARMTLVPTMSEAVRRHPDVAFFGVLYSDEPEHARRRLSREPLPFPTLLDPESQLVIDADVRGVPEIVILDREGTIVEHIVGPHDAVELDQALEFAR